KTTPSYYSTLEKIVGNLRESKRNAEQLLKNLFEAARNVDYDELTKCLLSLNSAKWIEKYRPEDYSDVISDVKKKLIEHIKNMKVSIKDMTLDLEDYDKIDSAYKKVSEMNKMKCLEEIFSDITQHLEEVND
ncbi:unnamed protein product, partial [Rotaria sp. Silwood2]